MMTPPLKAIKIWAHLTGVLLDLRYDEGLSLVAGLRWWNMRGRIDKWLKSWFITHGFFQLAHTVKNWVI